MKQKKIYLIGSLRNARVPELGNTLRDYGFHVFDDWWTSEDADEVWQRYEQERGHSYIEALDGLVAGHIFNYDYTHLNTADAGILCMPAGKSAHLELGYLTGQGKKTYIMLPEEPERWDVMYKFATVCLGTIALIEALKRDL